ncbi:glycosyltransferase [Citrobacter freundii]|nr:glycosyltransferase [Citrobacter freundii]QLW74144.1 glycosyltransferase [Citrobacter freundii]
MKKILFVSARFPWPLLTGDALRAYNQLKKLSKNNKVDIFSLESPSINRGDIDQYIDTSSSGNITKLRKIHNIISHSKATAVQCAMYYDQKSWQELRKLIITNKYDIIVFQLVRLEYLIKKTIDVRNQQGLKAKIYCDFIDALSLNMKNRAETESLWMKKICYSESKKLSLIESEIYESVDGAMIISERDANYIGKGEFYIVPNGVNIPKVSMQKDKKSEFINLAFWGNMSYYPNVKAALYLADLYKHLEKDKYKLHIIGAQPCKKIQKLDSQEGIVIHGYVDDLNSLLGSMDLAVFPIFDGSGLQNKVLEAFALKIPIVTTNIVLDSLPKLRKYAAVANDIDEFLNSIRLLSTNDNFIPFQNGNALQVLNEHYNWDVINNVIGSA